jgi:hypothetical protein
MSGKIAIGVDLISELEDVTTYDEAFSSEDWRPMDTERLRRVVEYLDRPLVTPKALRWRKMDKKELFENFVAFLFDNGVALNHFPEKKELSPCKRKHLIKKFLDSKMVA